MNGHNLILFLMGGCCTTADQEYFRSMESEVQGMLKNPELLKSPKVASQHVRDVMEYMYCKIKQDYLLQIRNKINKFDRFHPGDDAAKDKNQGSISGTIESADRIKEMGVELQNLKTNLKTDSERLKTFLKTLEVKVSPLRDNNSKNPSDQRVRESQIHKRSNLKIEQQKIEEDSPSSLRRALMDSDSVRVTQQLSSFQYRDSLNERISRQNRDVSNNMKITSEDRLEREQARNVDLNKQNIYLQKKLKIGEDVIASLREDLKKMSQTYLLQKRQWQEKCQKLYREVEETKKTFLTSSTQNSSMIIESIAEESQKSQTLIGHPEEKLVKKDLVIDSQVITEVFKSLSINKRQKKPSINSINESYTTMSQFQTIVRYFSHSKILPSFHNSEDAVKVRKDIINMFTQKISETRLLYAFDPINILSFNDYIDKEINLLVLVDIGNGTIVGGFAGEIDSDGYMVQSFLFSLRNGRQPLQLMASDKVNRISIDPTFINFGNAELKIRVNTRTFISNISGFQSRYSMKNRRISVQAFLGSENREHTVNSYEIHQICFQ